MNKSSSQLFKTPKTKRKYTKFTEQMKRRLKELVQSEEFSRNKACKELGIAPSTGKKYLQNVLPLPPRRRSPTQSRLQSVVPNHAQETPNELEGHQEHSTLVQQSSIAYWFPIPSETIIFYLH